MFIQYQLNLIQMVIAERITAASTDSLPPMCNRSAFYGRSGGGNGLRCLGRLSLAATETVTTSHRIETYLHVMYLASCR